MLMSICCYPRESSYVRTDDWDEDKKWYEKADERHSA